MNYGWAAGIRAKLLTQAEESNKKAQARMVELWKLGHEVVNEGRLVGPYTTNVTYFYDNGEMHSLVLPSNMELTPMEVIKV